MSGRTSTHTIHSQALGKEMRYCLALPDATPPEDGWPLVLLLHGLGRDHTTVCENPEFPTWFSGRTIALLCPQGEAGWYIDSPVDPTHRYASWIGELLAHATCVHPLTSIPQKSALLGWSMGGYGAMRLMCERPDRFAAISTIIGLLDFPSATLPETMPMGIPAAFGKEPALWESLNPLHAATRLHGKAIQILAGTEAFEYPMNQRFHAALQAEGICHDYRELPSGHVWETVRDTLPLALDFLEMRIGQKGIGA